MNISKITQAIDKLSKDDFFIIFTPFSYYNLDPELALEHILYNVSNQISLKNKPSTVTDIISEEDQEEINEYLYDKLALFVAHEEDDLLEEFVSFEWYNIIYFILFNELKHNNYTCMPPS